MRRRVPLLPSANPMFPYSLKNLTLYKFPGNLFALLSNEKFFPPSELTYIVFEPPTAHTSFSDFHATSVIPCKHKRKDGHQLHYDIQSRAGRILEWISNCVPNNSCFMDVTSFAFEL